MGGCGPHYIEVIMNPNNEETTGYPPIINRCLDVEEWYQYVKAYDFGSIKPTIIVLHHTWKPTVDQWRGSRSMTAMQRYYNGKGWHSGPHIYCAPDGIWLFTPMYDVGTHAGLGNGSIRAGWYSIGVEMVGDYDDQPPSGNVLRHALAVIDGLISHVPMNYPSCIRFHNRYSTKSCPGRAVTMQWLLIELVKYRSSRSTPI